jgi:putative transposase
MKKRHTPEQIVRKLHEADGKLAAGVPICEVARQLGISEATFHRWRNQYGRMKADAMKRLKELEQENARLKGIVADQAVDISILREVSRKNFCARLGGGRPSSTCGARSSGSPNVGRAGHSVNQGPANATWLGKRQKRPGARRASGGALAGEPPLRLPQGVGALEARRLEGEHQAGSAAVEGGGPESPRKAAKAASSS